MTTNFPGELDTFPNNRDIDLEDGLKAVQAKLGKNGSAVTTSVDYKLAGLRTDVDGKVSASAAQTVAGVKKVTDDWHFMSGHPWVETDLPTNGTTPCGALINATIQAMKPGQALMLPVNETGSAKFNISDAPIVIDRTIRFGGLGAARTADDNSDPDNVGVQLLYSALSGDAVIVRPPNAINSRIYPRLQNFQVVGNSRVVGATGGGGLVVDGRAVSATAVNGFAIEDVHVSYAKGDGLTLLDNVYEGRVVGYYGTDCGGHGLTARKAAETVGPGEISLDDIHTLDNLGDGIRLADGGSFSLGRISSSRNAGAALRAISVLLTALGVQCESNTGAQTVVLDGLILCDIGGLNIAYPTGYTGTGLAITNAASRNAQLRSTAFFGDCTTDISVAAGVEGVEIHGYLPSGANRLSLAAGSTALHQGQMVTGGLTVKADATGNAFDVLTADGTLVFKVTAGGDVQVAMGVAGAKLFFGAGTSLYEEAANLLRTNGKLLAIQGFATGNAVAATTPGSVVKKMQVFDDNGASLGFVPIYGSIT